MSAGPFELDPALPDSEPDPSRAFETHDVFNQAPPLAGRNLFEADPILIGALETLLEPDAEAPLVRAGAWWGSAEAQEVARLAEAVPPVLRTHDRQGFRIDQVDHHPAYHALMRRSVENGLHAALWDDDPQLAGRRNAVRAAHLYLAAQGESSHLASLSTTSAGVVALANAPDLVSQWLNGLLSRRYDHRALPPAGKLGLLLGAGFTEKQAGTDIKAITTVADEAGDGLWRLTGHKWFLTAPMADAFLVLAQAGGSPGCFLVPRVLEDGRLNAIHLQRLKPKLGQRATATAEAELTGALAFAVGEAGQGPGVVQQMLTLTRFDAAATAAGLMRAALTEAVHHARHRVVSGAALIDQPVMLRVLADLALESAAATALIVRLALAFDLAPQDDAEAAYVRVMTPVAKFWLTRTAPAFIAEAMECLGGNGYSEECALPRLYRDAPALAISEGPGNVLALDVLRALHQDARALDAVLADIGRDREAEGATTVVDIRSTTAAAVADIGAARLLAGQLALAGAGAALDRFAPRALGDAFFEARIAPGWGCGYGRVDGRHDCRGIVDSVVPPA